jgi:hypothetical protein
MAAAQTYEPIATTTLANSTTSTVTLSSIPSTYTDIRIVVSNYKSVNANQTIGMSYNSITTGYSFTYLNGNGAAASSGRASNASTINAGFTAGSSTTVPIMVTIDIMNYANTSTYKTALLRYSGERGGSGEVDAIVGLCSNTAAISSINFTMNADPTSYFSSGTVFTIYGIKAA